MEVLSTRYNTNSKTVEILQAGYTAASYTKGTNDHSLVFTFRSDAPLSSCVLETGKKDSPQSYFTTEGGLDLQNKLKAYGLSDVMFELVDKSGKKTYITQTQIYPNATGTEAGLNPSNGTKTVFNITEDASGLVTVTPSFKKVSTCADCASTANAVTTESLRKASVGQGQSDGKLDTQKNAINGINLPIGINYQNMSLGSMLTAVAKGYNSVVENLKVPDYVWKPETDLQNSDRGFPVKDDWGVVTGVVNGALTEITDQAQLVGMMLTVASDPIKTGKDLVNFATGAVTDWSQTKALISGFAGGMVGYDATYFASNKAPVYSGHGTGIIGGTIAAQATTGGVAVLPLLDVVKDAPTKLKGELDNLAAKLAKVIEALKTKLKSFDWSDTQIDDFTKKVEGWTSDDIERLLDDLGTDKSIFEAFRDGKFDVDASKALVLGTDGVTGKNLRRLHKNLTTLTNIKKILPSGITMDDITAALKNSNVTNKQDFLDQLSGFDASNIDELRDFLQKRQLRSYAVAKGDVPYKGVVNTDIQSEIAKRQSIREASQSLEVSSTSYDADYKASMKQISESSEKIAEAMADLHFGESNFIDLSYSTTAKQGQFDKVYRTFDDQGNATWHIVECKGGASQLGSRAGHQQCTKAYIESIIVNLESKTSSLKPEQRVHLLELRTAFDNNQVKSYSLKQPFNNDGSLGATKLTEYNL